MSLATILPFVLIVPPLMVAVIIHEVSHGLAAEKLGDPTARQLGRISLNPLVHIDLFMTIILPTLLILSQIGIVFGGAKPVPVNPFYFKDPRRGMLWVALAGPVSNFILAGISFLLLFPIEYIYVRLTTNIYTVYTIYILGGWCAYGILINLVLGIFNLFPVPPLDGGRIAVGLLPEKLAYHYARLEKVGLFLVVLCIFLEIPQAIFLPVIEFVTEELTKFSIVP